MSKFHALHVAEVKKETPDCVSVRFELSSAQQETFGFKQGQYLTLRKEIDGEDVRRSYSICTSPLDEQLTVAIKKVEGGLFSTFANDQLKVGDTLDVMPPMGNFTLDVSAGKTGNYAAIAAGSGITPVLSIMKTVLLVEETSTFTLFYGNKNTENIIFQEEIEALKNQFMGRLKVHYVLSREHSGADLFYGRINREKIEVFTKHLMDVKSTDAVFLCGPYEMIMSGKEVLEQAGLDRSKIHFELFYTPDANAIESKKEVVTNSKAAKLTITVDDNSFTFEMDSDQDMILDAALKAGADLPFACKGGVCCTCKAKLIEGEVKMTVNYALEPEEVDAGYILTCKSLALTDTVSITFDE